jgi:hypothetical protein
MRPNRTRTILALIAGCLVQAMLLGCMCGSLPGIKLSTSKTGEEATPTRAAPATATAAPAVTEPGGAPGGRAIARPYAYAEEEAAGLSEDQRGVLRDLGWPHAFSMVRLPDAGGTEHWVETWHYYDVGLVFVFRDRAFHHQEAERVVPAYQIAATAYRPNQFLDPGLLPELNWTEMEGFNALLPAEARFYGQDGVMLGYLNDQLAYVEAIAMLPREP